MRRLIAMVCIVAAGCASISEKDEDKDVLSASAGDWSATLSARNASGITGTARVQSAVVGLGANVAIRGATPGSSHPWHVHAGTCASTGGIMGSASSYPALVVSPDGNASANATVGVALVEGSAYSVNVHKSASEMSTVIACGDLEN